MSRRIGEWEFEDADPDADPDVEGDSLYLHFGEPRKVGETHQGHARFDPETPDGQLIAWIYGGATIEQGSG